MLKKAHLINEIPLKSAAEVAAETEETSEELAAEETNAAETEAEPADTEPIEETETSEEVSFHLQT